MPRILGGHCECRQACFRVRHREFEATHNSWSFLHTKAPLEAGVRDSESAKAEYRRHQSQGHRDALMRLELCILRRRVDLWVVSFLGIPAIRTSSGVDSKAGVLGNSLYRSAIMT